MAVHKEIAATVEDKVIGLLPAEGIGGPDIPMGREGGRVGEVFR